MGHAADILRIERLLREVYGSAQDQADISEIAAAVLQETGPDAQEPPGGWRFRTKRWKPLRPHDRQQRFLLSPARFNVVPAARRSGKTENAKRRLVRKAVSGLYDEETYFVAAAPTYKQAKKIYWRDLCRLVPPGLVIGKPSKSELTIELKNGAIIMVTGMDVPERIEGPPLGHILLDEYANMVPEVWPEHVQPALIDTCGSADLIGTPEGRNHYWELYNDAQSDQSGEWAVFHWLTAEIQPAAELEKMRQRMDERTFRQEAEGSFESWLGRAYYAFGADNVASLAYDPSLPLIFCFDFNVSPGCAVVVQEHEDRKHPDDTFTAVIDEIWIRDGSNTPLVCSKLVERYRKHQGEVLCYGDPAGGQRRTSAPGGTDWELIRKALERVWPDVTIEVRPKAPSQRDRLNAMNSRIRADDGTIRLRVDPGAKRTIRDLEGVSCLDNGQIDKTDKWLTNLADALGYYVEHEHSVAEDFWIDEQM